MNVLPKIPTLVVALLAAGGVQAENRAPDAPTARAAELAAAQADLQRAARRVAELSGNTAAQTRALERVQARTLRRPVLGVLLAPDSSGVRITGVTPDSAAAKAGLHGGDHLTAVDGVAIAGADADVRLANAREMLGKLEAGKPVRLGYLRAGRNATVVATPQLGDRLRLWTVEGAAPLPALTLGVDPRVHTEVLRLEGLHPCEGDACRLPLLADAFRWKGLNLATVDTQLGRYFGTSSGVLVLSAGDSLAGLQPGDVLRSIDGKHVATPREAMAALQARQPGSRVSVQYLRDRKPANTQVTVPKAFPWPLPPRPPMPAMPPLPPTPPPSAMNDGVPAPIDGPVVALAPLPPLESPRAVDRASMH